ncbi:MAG: recombinase family protein [Oscillospiraceae bacterium]
MQKYLMYLRKSRADGEHETIEEILVRHEKILQEYAEKNIGKAVPEENIFREIVSGETIKDRPLMNKLLKCIQNEQITGVLVIEPQRLSRGDLHDCGTIIRAFQYTNTLVYTPTKTYDLSEKYDRKFFEMELMRGNDYLEYVKEILMRGRLASVSDGNYIGSIPPFGYSKEKIDKNYVLVENDESNVVRLIFDLFVNQNMGTSKIANHLNSIGIKPRKNNYWSDSTIRDILRNPVYIGKIRWNWRKTVKTYKDGEIVCSRPKSTPDSWIIIDGKHNGLISEEVFNAAQKRFGQNPRVKKEYEIVNPFAGLVKCECGKSMVYKKFNKSSPRIICPNQPRCENRSVLYSEFESEVIIALKKYINDFKIKISNGDNQSESIQNGILESLIKELKTIENQQDKLYELLEQGIYTNAIFIKRNTALAEKRKKITSEIENLKTSIPNSINYEEKIVQLSNALNTLQNPDIHPKIKNEFLKVIINNIYYTRKNDNRTRNDDSPFTIKIILNL